jgi:hypothetical protein
LIIVLLIRRELVSARIDMYMYDRMMIVAFSFSVMVKEFGT